MPKTEAVFVEGVTETGEFVRLQVYGPAYVKCLVDTPPVQLELDLWGWEPGPWDGDEDTSHPDILCDGCGMYYCECGERD